MLSFPPSCKMYKVKMRFSFSSKSDIYICLGQERDTVVAQPRFTHVELHVSLD